MNTSTAAAERAQFEAQRRYASDDYFETLGIPILTGRAFESTDRAGEAGVLIINATMAADVREFGLAQGFTPVFFMASRQVTPDRMQLLVRSAGEPLDLAAELREAVWDFDGSIPIAGLTTMEARITGSLAQPRFRMLLVGLFAAMALVLAATGLYGVLSFFVRQRTHELGIRVALGAAPRDVIGVVLKRGMVLVGFGIGIGLLGAFAGGRVLQSLLYEVAPSDVLTFGGVSICLAAVASIACIVPALRAIKVDPQEVLRVE